MLACTLKHILYICTTLRTTTLGYYIQKDNAEMPHAVPTGYARHWKPTLKATWCQESGAYPDRRRFPPSLSAVWSEPLRRLVCGWPTFACLPTAAVGCELAAFSSACIRGTNVCRSLLEDISRYRALGGSKRRIPCSSFHYIQMLGFERSYPPPVDDRQAKVRRMHINQSNSKHGGGRVVLLI